MKIDKLKMIELIKQVDDEVFDEWKEYWVDMWDEMTDGQRKKFVGILIAHIKKIEHVDALYEYKNKLLDDKMNSI